MTPSSGDIGYHRFTAPWRWSQHSPPKRWQPTTLLYTASQRRWPRFGSSESLAAGDTVASPSATRAALPYAPGDAARVMDANELVACCRDVEVGLLFVHEEGVRHPNVFDELGSHWESLNTRPLPERQPRVRPELTEVEIQREVLRVKEEQIRGRGVSRVWQSPIRGGGDQVSSCR